VHTTEDLQQLYERIHSIIGTLMAAQNFYLALLDEATDMISFPYYRHRVDPPPVPRKRSLGMTEYVLRKGRPVLADAAEFQRLYDLGEYRPFGEPAIIWLGVPLIVKGRTFGVMAVQDQENLNAYGEEEKRLLSFVAGQTALAIERKRTAEEYVTQTRLLRESEQRFSKAFSAIPANVSLVRLRDERCVEVNEAAMVFTGYTREEMIGHTSVELGLWVNPEDRLKFFREFTKEGRVVSMEAESRTKSGRIDTVLIAAEQIEVQGEPHILTLTVAITERKKAEEELLRSLARERELSSLKSSFVSLVSHEFRTPIGIIHSSAEILERYIDRLPLEERRDHLAAIQSHAWRMAALMEEVLLFGRAEAGRLDFRPTAFSLREVCQRWVDEMALATKRCCPIGVSFGKMPDNALGDPDLLRHVISNLLSNAVKYSPPGREVRLTVNCEDAQAVFRVIDRGLGIPAADRERLFTAFQRGANVRHLPGTGLGLVVIRHCLDLHQGTIEILSQENLGTTVTVRLPLFENRP
jgi:PAS domain S-box-containing protein